MAFKILRAALYKAKVRTKRNRCVDSVSISEPDNSSSTSTEVKEIDRNIEESLNKIDYSNVSIPSPSLSVTVKHDSKMSLSAKTEKIKSVSFDETRNTCYLDANNSHWENGNILWYTDDELGAIERQNVELWTKNNVSKEIIKADTPRGLERLTEPHNYYRSRQKARKSRKLIIREQRRQKRWKLEPDSNKLADYYKTLGTTESLEAHARGLEDYLSTLNLCNFE